VAIQANTTKGDRLIMLRALRSPAFALFWGGQTISVLGDRIFQVALAWWVLEKTGSALAMGTVMILTTAPMTAFLLVGGVVVDRVSRARLMLVADVIRGLVLSLASVLAFTDSLTIAHVYAFALLSGVVDAFYRPAFSAVVPQTVRPEHLPSANSLVSISGQISGIVGPAVGALVVKLAGATLAFVLDGLSFWIAAVSLLPILKFAAAPEHPAERRAFTQDLREGLATVMATPWLWITIAIAGVSNIAYAGPMEVALPFLIRDRLRAGVEVLGSFFSASALGSVLAALWLGRMGRLRRRGLMLYGAWMTIGLLVMAIGLLRPIPAILLAAFGIGACNTILGLAWVSALQERIPQRLLGRVTSVDYLGSYLFLPLGYAVGGWATQAISPQLVFIIGGALETTLIALGLLHPDVRSLD